MLASLSTSFVAIFVALDVVGALPMYLTMTRDLTPEARKKIVNSSMLTAFCVAAAFMAMGQLIFAWLGITFSDFKIAGGIILLLVSLMDLLGGPDRAHSNLSGSTGIVPLAVPLITGPGVLTQSILLSGTAGYPITLTALAANYVLAWVILRHSGGVTRIMGKDGTVVVSKVAALLLAAIAIAMIRNGVLDIIHGVKLP